MNYASKATFIYEPACDWYIKISIQEIDGVKHIYKQPLNYYWAKTNIPKTGNYAVKLT